MVALFTGEYLYEQMGWKAPVCDAADEAQADGFPHNEQSMPDASDEIAAPTPTRRRAAARQR